ncbi:MAG: hypothetical protein AAGB34_02195 [Planctomycetota bacterium]
MAKSRRKAPALYELIHDRPRGAVGTTVRRPDSHGRMPEPEVDEDRILGIAPGQALRVPVGYVFFGAFVVLALMIGAYLGGRAVRGQEAEEKMRTLQVENQELKQALREAAPIVQDPLNQLSEQTKTTIDDVLRGEEEGNTDAIESIVPSGPFVDYEVNVPTEDPSSPTLFLVDGPSSDPRVDGMNYFVVVHLSRGEAEKVAQFLVENGISAARLSVNSRGLADVVALRGFASGTLSDPPRMRLERQLKALGRDYDSQGGATDFESLYLKKFTR